MESLRDPKRQIRLLHLMPGAIDDNVSCEMTVHGFDESTPEYLAISYTWGDTAYPRGIFIDNELRMVRQNCHYALWQARCHYPGTYIWMDAICIDQDNLNEKGCQVRMMGKIYAQATQVLVCVGPDDGDSEFLWNFSHAFTYHTLCQTQPEAYEWISAGPRNTGFCCERIWDQWEASNSVETLERFLKACEKFKKRSYWERLWILQEVALARAKKILCGKICLPWTVTHNLDLLQILHKAQALFKTSEDNTFDVVVRFLSIKVMEHYELIDYRQFKCGDVRDRIFGTRELLRFHDRKLHMEPDYGKCALELAMTIMRRNMPWTYTSDLLCLLEINMNCPEFQGLVVRRSHQDTNMLSEVPSHYNMKFKVTRLRRDAKGRLTCSLGSLHTAHKDLAMLDFVTSASNDRSLNDNLSKCVKVYADGEPAIFLGNEAREGDYLAEVEWLSGLYFVLRCRTGNTFDIVSQGFSLRSHTICWDQCDCANQGIAHDTLEDACFATSLSVEDVVVFIAQDLLGCDEKRKLQHDPTARLRRLITPVSSRFGPIAIMKDDTCGIDPHGGADEAESDGVKESDDF